MSLYGVLVKNAMLPISSSIVAVIQCCSFTLSALPSSAEEPATAMYVRSSVPHSSATDYFKNKLYVFPFPLAQITDVSYEHIRIELWPL